MVFVTMYEELCHMIVGSMAAGIAIRLLEAIAAGNGKQAAEARLGILLATIVSVVGGFIVLCFLQPVLSRQADLEPESLAIVDDAILPMCMALLPAALQRVSGNLLSAMEAYTGLLLVGLTEAIAGGSAYAALQPSMGVRAYPWASLLRSIVSCIVGVLALYWSEMEA